MEKSLLGIRKFLTSAFLVVVFLFIPFLVLAQSAPVPQAPKVESAPVPSVPMPQSPKVEPVTVPNVSTSQVSDIETVSIPGVADVSESNCSINGEKVPCDEFWSKTWWLWIIMLVFFVLGMIFFVFWIWMLVHAASNPIENKVMWIILLVLIQITAIVYYFAVKRKFNKSSKQ